MDAYIEFRNVVKKFDDFVALDHVSLQIPKGAFVTLLGPSGCGKTTLMRQLAGFSEPEEGDVLVDGKRMNGLPPFKRNTPLVFQEYALFPHMTVYENISYGLKLKKAPKEEKDRKVAEMLEMFNLQGLDGRFPKQLSGGQQQRVAFARALVMGQEILLLDEPLSNLDAKLRVEVRTELRQIQQKFGITTMYVTHDQDEALSMSDIIAVMRRGRIEQIGSPWEIYFRPAVVLTRANDLATGSARSVSGFDVYKAIEYCRDLLENFGGHTYAAGLSMKVENVPLFTRRFEEFVAQNIRPEQMSSIIDIDAEIDFKDITPRFFNDLKKFNPFGPENTKPIFCTHNVYDYGTSKVVGRDQEHIKLELVDNKSNNVMNGIAFGQSSHVRYIKTKRSFDICYTIEENTHERGEVQLQIEDIKPN